MVIAIPCGVRLTATFSTLLFSIYAVSVIVFWRQGDFSKYGSTFKVSLFLDHIGAQVRDAVARPG